RPVTLHLLMTLTLLPTRRSSDLLSSFEIRRRPRIGGNRFITESLESARIAHLRQALFLHDCRRRSTSHKHLCKNILRDFGADLADRKSTRLNSSHVAISYAVFCL